MIVYLFGWDDDCYGVVYFWNIDDVCEVKCVIECCGRFILFDWLVNVEYDF